jgi:hypothetical protein
MMETPATSTEIDDGLIDAYYDDERVFVGRSEVSSQSSSSSSS